MIRSLVRRALRLLGCAALVLAAAAPAQGAQVQLPVAVVLPVQILGADSFCTGGFVAGGTASAPTLTSVVGGGPGPLTCAILGAPSGTVAPNSSVSLTMSCSGGTSPYTYLWSPGGATSGNLATTVAANTTFTATATDSATPPATSTKSVAVTVGSGGGGGGGLVDTSACTALGLTPEVIEMRWGGSVTALTSSFGPANAIVVHFTTSTPLTASNYKGYIKAAQAVDGDAFRIGALSTTPCDFSGGVPIAGGGTAAFINDIAPTLYFALSPTVKSGYPTLQQGTSYFFNIRNASCTSASGTCNMIITLSKPSGT